MYQHLGLLNHRGRQRGAKLLALKAKSAMRLLRWWNALRSEGIKKRQNVWKDTGHPSSSPILYQHFDPSEEDGKIFPPSLLPSLTAWKQKNFSFAISVIPARSSKCFKITKERETCNTNCQHHYRKKWCVRFCPEMVMESVPGLR